MSAPVVAVALGAVLESSRVLVSESQILAILVTGDGPGHLVRALFGDRSFDTLNRVSVQHGIVRSTIWKA